MCSSHVVSYIVYGELCVVHSGVISSTATPMTSQPITVQIQQTEQGTRLMIPTGQLSQLPGWLHFLSSGDIDQSIASVD